MEPATKPRSEIINMIRRSKRVKTDSNGPPPLPSEDTLSPEPRSQRHSESIVDCSLKRSDGVFLGKKRLNGKSRSMTKNGKRKSPYKSTENGVNISMDLPSSRKIRQLTRRLKNGSKKNEKYGLLEKSEIERKAETLSQRYSQCLENFQKSAEDPFEKFKALKFGQKWSVYMNRLMNYPRYINSSYLVTMNHFTCSSRGKPQAVLYTSFGYERECVERLLPHTKVFIVSDSSNSNISPIFFKDKKSKNLRTLLPRKKFKRSFGAFHPKLTLIKFRDKLRVIIGSGNLATGDWLIWSNVYFKLDFPLKIASKQKKRTRLEERYINQTLDQMKKSFQKRSEAKSEIEKRTHDRAIDALLLKGSHFVHNEISKKSQGTLNIDSQYEKGFLLPLSQISCALNSQVGAKSRFNKSHRTGSMVEPRVNRARVWKRNIFEYYAELNSLGYNFKDYLTSFLKYSMKEYFPQVQSFLKIDLDDYKFDVNDFYIIGSLPGYYTNHINNNPKLLKQRAEIKNQDVKDLLKTTAQSDDTAPEPNSVPQTFSNLMCFDENNSLPLQLDTMQKNAPNVMNMQPKLNPLKEEDLEDLLDDLDKELKLEKSMFLDQNGDFKIHGLCLARVLLHRHPSRKEFNLDNLMITYQSSSLGMVDFKLLFDLAYSFVPGWRFEWSHLSKELKEHIISVFNVVFPTEEYIQDSLLGPETAKCVFLKKSLYHTSKFRKEVMAQYEGNGRISNNGQVIPHVKAMIISNDQGTINDDTVLYLGSHNLTKAAWGRYEKYSQRIYVSNYELGVILPPFPGSKCAKREIVSKLGFKYPPQKYEKKQKPFMF